MLKRIRRQNGNEARWALVLALAPALLWGHQAAAAPGAVDPVLFVPFEMSPELRAQEEFLRQLLAARLVATGRFSETATAQTEAAVQDCVRRVNREAHSETCWIRLGQGQGARLMATGQIKGDGARCAVSLRLTELETRTSRRMHVSRVAPCNEQTLAQEMERGARALAGLAPAPMPAAYPRAQPTRPPVGHGGRPDEPGHRGYGPVSPAAHAAAAAYPGADVPLSAAPAAHAASPPVPAPLPVQRAGGTGTDGSGGNTLLWVGVGAAVVVAAGVVTYYLVKNSSESTPTTSNTSGSFESSGGATLGLAGLGGVVIGGGTAWLGVEALSAPAPPDTAAATTSGRPPLGAALRGSF